MPEPRSKKQKKSHPPTPNPPPPPDASAEIDTSKPTALFTASGVPRNHTLSLALPSSILSNAQSLELKTQLAGQLARCCAVFCVDEIVIFSDNSQSSSKDTDLLLHLLSYLETPQYLRKHLFPIHQNLRFAGLLAPLDIPSHLRFEEACLYREGVTVEGSTEAGRTLVDAGLKRKVVVDAEIPPQNRVTLKFKTPEEGAGKAKGKGEIEAAAVSPDTPRLENGYYWGYQLRTASSLSTVFTEAPFEGGYDVTIGTSERGIAIEDLIRKEGEGGIPKYKHMLIAFGGLAGLEQALKADEELKKMGVKEAKELFDFWVDVCKGQGSRTIRTEEATWIALSRLREVVVDRGL